MQVRARLMRKPLRESGRETPSGPVERSVHDCEGRRGHLVPIDVALAKGIALAPTIHEIESVPIEQAAGRILGSGLVAPISLPPFSYSAMDGFAVRTDSLSAERPTRIPVVGRVLAGEPGTNSLPTHPAGALRILTGARMPDSADAVIRQEDVEVDGDAIIVSRTPDVGENIRCMGEDIAASEVLMEAGTLLGAREIGLAASVGCAELAVKRRVRVSIFSTGSELRQPGESLEPGQIYNSNRFLLRCLLDKPWIELNDLGACCDDPALLSAKFTAASSVADVVITTGGVSVGDEDHVPEVIRGCGGSIDVANVAIKPGKPLTIGRLGHALYIGLPGNPAAAFTTFKVVGEELLNTCAGLRSRRARDNPAIAGFEYSCRPGRTTYLPATVKGYSHESAPILDLLPKSNSGRVYLLGRAEGFAVVGHDRSSVSPGDLVGWFPL